MAYSYNRGNDDYRSHQNQNRPNEGNWNQMQNQQYQSQPPPPGKYQSQGGYQPGPPGGYQSGPPQGYGGYQGGPGGPGGSGAPGPYQGAPLGQRNSNQLGFLPPRPAATPVVQRTPHNDHLWQIFKGVDTDNSNSISERELGDALVNADYQRFDPVTIQMMIKMFDVDRSGSINFPEFCSLWDYLNQWRQLFDRFDKDRSGAISFREFSLAIADFGYSLSPDFMQFFFSVYVPRGQSEISFDLFVQACVNLQRLTNVFKVHDKKRDGTVTLKFEEFLAGMLSLT